MHNQFTFLDELSLEKEAQNSLSTILSRTVSGSPEVYITPMGENNGPDTLLAEWDKVYQANSAEVIEVLDEMEISNRSKYGPRSIAVPWSDRKEGVYDYFKSQPQMDFNTLSSSPDVLNYHHKLRRGALRPLSLQNAADYLKSNTSSGLPFMRKKKFVKEEVLNNFETLLSRKDPCVLYTRTQEQLKTRAVWGFPITDTLNETRFYRPLLEVQKKLDWRAAIIGPEKVDEMVTKLILNAEAEK